MRLHPAEQLAAARLQTQAVIALAVGTGLSAQGSLLATLTQLSAAQAGLLVFSALASGVFASLLQAFGQRSIPAAKAQPIYALVPACAALWAFFILREPISTGEIIGGVGAVAAALLASSDGRESRDR